MLGNLRARFWAAYIAAIKAWIIATPPNTADLEAEMDTLGAQRAADEIAAFENL